MPARSWCPGCQAKGVAGIKSSHDIMGNVQLNISVALQESVDGAALFYTRPTVYDMSNKQTKRIRDIKKSLPRAAAAPYQLPYQQSVLAGPSRACNFYSSDHAYQTGFVQKSQKRAPNVDRCNACNMPGHRSAMCNLAMNRPYYSQQRFPSTMMPAPLPAYVPGQYSQPAGLPALPLTYQSPPLRE